MDPEKKKTVVIGALFVAMLGIGAFQFSKMGGEEAPAPPAKAEESQPDPSDETSKSKDGKAKNPMYSAPLPGRDPFRPAPFSVSKPENAAPVVPIPTPLVKADPRGTPLPKPGTDGWGPMPSGPLPDPGNPGPIAPAKVEFQGTLIGVVVGDQSAAVFRFGTSERIVTVGSDIEPGVRLISVSTRRAVIRFHGQTLTINLKDEAPANPAGAPAPNLPESPAPKAPPTLPDTGSETPND